MFKNGIDLKSLGIWNLVITAVVLIVRFFAVYTDVLAEPLWAMPLFTLGLGLLLIYRATNKLDTGRGVKFARLALLIGSVDLVMLKILTLDPDRLQWLFLTANAFLLAGLCWYFLRWYLRKEVLI